MGVGGAWLAAVYGVIESRTRLKWLSSSSSNDILIYELSEIYIYIYIYVYVRVTHFAFYLKLKQLWKSTMWKWKLLSNVWLFMIPWTGPTRLLYLWNSPGKNTGVDSQSLPRGSSQPRDRIQISCIASGSFTVWATRESTTLQFKKLRYQAQPRKVYRTQKIFHRYRGIFLLFYHYLNK